MNTNAGGVANWSGTKFELCLGAEFCVFMLAGDEAGLSQGAISWIQPQAPEAIDDMVVRFASGDIWAIQAKAGILNLSWEGEFGKALRQLSNGVIGGQIDPNNPGDRAVLAVEDYASGTVKAFGRWLEKAHKQSCLADLEEVSTSKLERRFIRDVGIHLKLEGNDIIYGLKALHIRQTLPREHMGEHLRSMLVRSCGVPASQAEKALDLILAQVAKAAPDRGKLLADDIKSALGEIPSLWPHSELPFGILDRPRLEEIDRSPVRPRYIERSELVDVDPRRGVLVVGRKGAGKTRSLASLTRSDLPSIMVYRDIREPHVGMLLVAARRLARKGPYQLIWDDIQKNPKIFAQVLEGLTRRGDEVRVLAATRREDISQVEKIVHEDLLSRLDRIELRDLDYGQAQEIAQAVSLAMSIKMDRDAQEAFAAHIIRGDPTPLFAVASATLIMGELKKKGRARRIKAENIGGLDQDLVLIWKRLYHELDNCPHAQSFLHCLRLLQEIRCPAEEKLVQLVYTDLMERRNDEFRQAKNSLEGQWIRYDEGFLISYEVSMEAVPWEPDMLQDAEKLARMEGNDLALGILRQSLSRYYYEKLTNVDDGQIRKSYLQRAAELEELAIQGFKRIMATSLLAGSLNDASVIYSDLADIETSWDGRQKMLQMAIDYVDEAIGINRDRGHMVSIAMSLSNASILYGDIARLENSRNVQQKMLEKRKEYIEDALKIYQYLGMKADIAKSLNNASTCCRDLADLEKDRDIRQRLLKKAINFVEMAIIMRRDLGAMANVAGSLNNVSIYYSELADLESSHDKRQDYLRKAVDSIEEGIGIYQDEGELADMAASLHTASICYSRLAYLEPSQDKRQSLLKKSIDYSEAAIGIYRDLGQVKNMAVSLHSASVSYCDLVDSKSIHDERQRLLKKAINYIEEAIGIHRNLQYLVKMAECLNAACRYYLIMAEEMEYPERQAFFESALDYNDEAVTIFRDFGPIEKYAESLKASVIIYIQAPAFDNARLMMLLDEGEALAGTMNDVKGVKFYADLRDILRKNMS